MSYKIAINKFKNSTLSLTSTKMSAVILLLAIAIGVSAGVPAPPTAPRIVGGSLATIDQYPFGVVLLITSFETFLQSCGGTIINNRAVLTAAHCFDVSPLASQWRIRVGSSFASSGGVVHNVNLIINHPDYSQWTIDSDIAVIHSGTAFSYSTTVQPASIAGANYNVPDNQEVWAIGWGITETGFISEQLRHVQIWTVNQEICKSRYTFPQITDNMLCSGWLDVGGRDQCHQDSGGPLLHNNVVIGVCSFGNTCADPYYPGVNARVSRYTSWIVASA